MGREDQCLTLQRQDEHSPFENLKRFKAAMPGRQLNSMTISPRLRNELYDLHPSCDVVLRCLFGALLAEFVIEKITSSLQLQ